MESSKFIKKNIEKKIRVTLPQKTYNILERDIEEFGVTKNYILNYLYKELKNEYKGKESKFRGETQVIQFSLNKKNRLDYYMFLEENNIQNEAEFFREIITIYTEKARKNRELFLYKKIYTPLKKGIQERRVTRISFKDGRETIIEPYYLGSSKQELKNYIFCFDLQEREWKNYKLRNIVGIYLKFDLFEVRDKKYIDEVKEEFDPFLSKGKKVIVRLTDTGKRLLDELEINRPKILEVSEDKYILECSIEKAKRYFTFFLDEVEILEPKELREWFKNGFKRGYKLYNKE